MQRRQIPQGDSSPRSSSEHRLSAITPNKGLPSNSFLLQPKPILIQNNEPMRPCGLMTVPRYWFQTFPFGQFHVLFNSLFRVLCNFPSRYLFAIGLSPVFSFGRYLPPDLRSILKLRDSSETYHNGVGLGPYGAITLYGATFQWTWTESTPENVP
jgi:hypothetical protein